MGRLSIQECLQHNSQCSRYKSYPIYLEAIKKTKDIRMNIFHLLDSMIKIQIQLLVVHLFHDLSHQFLMSVPLH